MIYKSLQLTLTFITLYYTFLASAEPVNIIGSSEKLSTDIEYAIYNAPNRNYIQVDGTSLSGDLMPPFDFTHAPYTPTFDQNDKKMRWKIEKQMWDNRYALKNVHNGEYLSYDHAMLTTKAAASGWSDWNMGWKFIADDAKFERDLQTVKLQANTGFVDYGVSCPYPKDCASCINKKWRWGVCGLTPYSLSWGWALIPLTIPLRCELVESTNPVELKSLSSQLDQQDSLDFTNNNAFEETYTDFEKEVTYTTTTTFTSTSGSERTYGFNIGYETPAIPVVGSFSAGYHMDWKYYGSKTEESTQSKEIKTTMQSSIRCPARSICKRDVLKFKPSTKKLPVTVTATCDGVKYTTKGAVQVDGWVKVQVVDHAPKPLDCEYYTNTFGDIGKGKLPFCDTCNDDKHCEICRDGYILLDGQCITAYHCENTCGGEVKGDGATGKDDKIPWSGGWCDIKDESKHTSGECGKVLGHAR